MANTADPPFSPEITTSDASAKQAYDAAYYVDHREERLAYRRAYYAGHREAKRAYNAARVASRAPIVYAWFAPDGACEYVGRGTVHRSRHHRYAPWWTPEHYVLTMTCETEWQAMEYEGKWGAAYQPRHNKDGYRHAIRGAA
jgi:hypothetical protein